MRRVALMLAFGAFVFGCVRAEAQGTSKDTARLNAYFKEHPDADADGDGVLTLQEALAHRTQAGRLAEVDQEAFDKVAAELEKELDAVREEALKEGPLSFPKGNGLRIVMTGHSWVGPGRKTLPEIAAAAGLDGHHQRAHTGGGAKGSVPYIWESETVGQDGEKRQILLPAIATGQWDVMTWGVFMNDTPRDYMNWIDICLKYNPDMVFYIQDGWPTYNAALAKLPKEEALDAIDKTQEQIRNVLMKSLYDALNAKYPGKVHIIPAGAAITAMHHLYAEGKLPGFDCVSEHLGGKKGIYRDGGHLSQSNGMQHLAGYLYYGTLYKKSAALLKDFHPAGVPQEIDTILRDVAWKSIIASPMSGVTDKDGNGIGDEIE